MNNGDKVICVDDSNCRYCERPMGLKKGLVYVVSSIGIHENGLPIVGLIGWKSACAPFHLFPRHMVSAARFRLLAELKSEQQQEAQQSLPNNRIEKQVLH